MNKIQITGRLTAEPDVRWTNGNPSMCIARFRLAVDRRFKREGEPDADFIGVVAFGKTGEHVEKYYHKGMKVGVAGRVQTGNYDHKDGYKVYTFDVVAEEIEFEEKRDANSGNQNNGFTLDNGQAGGYGQQGYGGQAQQQNRGGQQALPEGFMDVDDTNLPWN